jgi:hypothetical protein
VLLLWHVLPMGQLGPDMVSQSWWRAIVLLLVGQDCLQLMSVYVVVPKALVVPLPQQTMLPGQLEAEHWRAVARAEQVVAHIAEDPNVVVVMQQL